MRYFSILSIILTINYFLSSCYDYNTTDNLLELGIGKYSGTFDIIYNANNESNDFSKSGEIEIEFFENEYEYKAVVNYCSEENMDTILFDFGNYEIKNDTISMVDFSYYSSAPYTPSLNIFGDFLIYNKDRKLKLTCNNRFATWNFTLKKIENI